MLFKVSVFLYIEILTLFILVTFINFSLVREISVKYLLMLIKLL